MITSNVVDNFDLIFNYNVASFDLFFQSRDIK